jgi:hypothetical protein
MRDANFLGVFVGIESPDPMTLTLMKKKQTGRATQSHAQEGLARTFR